MVGGGGSAPKLAFTSLGLTPQTPKLATLTVTIMHARSQGVVDAQSSWVRVQNAHPYAEPHALGVPEPARPTAAVVVVASVARSARWKGRRRQRAAF